MTQAEEWADNYIAATMENIHDERKITIRKHLVQAFQAGRVTGYSDALNDIATNVEEGMAR